MKNTHTLTTRALLPLLAAFCLSAGAAAQPAKGREQSPAA